MPRDRTSICAQDRVEPPRGMPTLNQALTNVPADWNRPWIFRILALIVIVAFSPCLFNDFVNWDDNFNFVRNYNYRGIGWPNLRWAWGTFHLGVYQPLAWMLFGVEYEIWGMSPRGYHLTSILLHIANVLVLYVLTFRVLDRCLPEATRRNGGVVATGAALAAALFAVHPLRVEAVAWVSCQPYLLCALFSMLTVLAYLSAMDREGASRRVLLATAVGLFTAAMLSKAAAACLPLVLIVLDDYPLRRRHGSLLPWPRARFVSFSVEKVPFFLVSALFMELAVRAKHASGSVAPFTWNELSARTAQALYGICFYTTKTIAPFRLSAYYPLPSGISLTMPGILRCALLVIGVTLVALGLRRRWPGLLAAWLSYVLLMLPNLGLVRINDQIAADRYCYIATAALVVLCGYVLCQLQVRLAWHRPYALAVVVGSGVLVLSVLTALQCRTWHDSKALWTQATRWGAGDNFDAVANLADAMTADVKDPQTARAFERACHLLDVAVKSNHKNWKARSRLGPTLNDFGVVLEAQGRLPEAMEVTRRAIACQTVVCQTDPSDFDARGCLGTAYFNLGRLQNTLGRGAEALEAFEQSRAVREALVHDDSVTASYRDSLATVESQIALLYKRENQPSQALRAFEHARDLYQGLVLDFPKLAYFRQKLDQMMQEILALRGPDADLRPGKFAPRL